jgi:DNA primase
LTAQHGQLLGRNCDTVILLFDGDEAGRRAADRAVEVLFASPVDVAICVLPDDLDPADLLELPDGAQRFQEAVESATDALTYKLQRLQQELGARDGISSRQKVIEQFVGDLAGLGIASMDGVRRGLIMERLAEITSIPTVDLESSLLRKSSTRRGPARTSSDDETLPDDAAPAPVADIPRARRTAERNLLALLLHDPELGRDRIDDLPLATTFRDVIHRHIAQTTLELIASGDPMSMQTVLSGLDDPAASELAARLFFVGEQLLADASEDPAACLGQAVADLASCDARDTHAACDETYRANKSNPKQAQQAAREIVEQLRHAGGPVAAIAQGTRS